MKTNLVLLGISTPRSFTQLVIGRGAKAKGREGAMFGLPGHRVDLFPMALAWRPVNAGLHNHKHTHTHTHTLWFAWRSHTVSAFSFPRSPFSLSYPCVSPLSLSDILPLSPPFLVVCLAFSLSLTHTYICVCVCVCVCASLHCVYS